MIKHYNHYLFHSNQPSGGDGAGSGSSSEAQGSTGNDGAGAADVSIESLQGIEGISEADLGGPSSGYGADDKSTDDKSSSEDDSAGSGSKDDKSDDVDTKSDDDAEDDAKTGDDDKADDDDSDGAKDDDKGDDKDTDKDQRPPKGYVKLEALRDARDENRFLKGEVAKLKVQVFEASQTQKPARESLVTEKETANYKDFKVLSEEDFESKFEDDQVGGMKYLQKLGKYQDFQRRQTEDKIISERDQRELEDVATELQSVYDTTADQMEDILPGIFDDPAVQNELSEFAEGLGFTEDMFYLTNPETRIIIPGETEPLVLGEQAADILKVLTTARTKLGEKQTVDSDSIREELKAEVEKELRADIEKELLTKFKKDAGDDFKTIDDIPNSETDNKFQGKVLSDGDFAKLSSKEQELYLSGA